MKLTSETKLLAVMGAIVALGVGFLTFSNRLTGGAETPPTPMPTPGPVPKEKFDELLKGTRHLKGNANARFTVIEFADFQCPNCRRTYHKYLKNFGKSLDVRFGYRHFPLENIHPFAMNASVASEVGAKQGKFWETYEQLLEDPEKEIDLPFIAAAAAKAGIPKDIFEANKMNPELGELVHGDQKLARELGVDQTPTFYVYDKQTQKVTVAVGTVPLLNTLKEVPGMPTPEPTPSAAK